MLTPDPTAPIGRELLPDSATLHSGRLAVGGVDLLELATVMGTPLFVYDEQHLRSRCAEALAAFGEGTAYASKAFLCQAMARLAYEEGLWLDVATGGEAFVALSAGVPANRLVFHGNNKSPSELEQAIRAGVGRIVVDSFDEIDRIEKILSASQVDSVSSVDPQQGASGSPRGSRQPPAPSPGALHPAPGLLHPSPGAPHPAPGPLHPGPGPLNLVVRVTPGVEAHTHHFVRTGQVDSKFGFGLASGDGERACERIQALQGARLVGLHAHVGSQIFRLDPFERTVSLLVPLLERFSLGELSIGGGLGVPYVAGESAPSIAQWGQAVKSAAQRAGVDPSVRILAEPGRSIVATAGVTLYTVGTIKEISGVRTYVSVDGGMSDNPRPVLYGSGYEAFLPAKADAARDRLVRLVGKHCESGDVLISESWLPQETAVGDVLAVPVTGAYGYSMASNYNKVPRPAVVFVKNGEARVVVRRETYEDLVTLEDSDGSVVSLGAGPE